jgi:hypothetical protein
MTVDELWKALEYLPPRSQVKVSSKGLHIDDEVIELAHVGVRAELHVDLPAVKAAGSQAFDSAILEATAQAKGQAKGTKPLTWGTQ